MVSTQIMWLLFLIRLGAIVCVSAFAPARLFACKCGGVHGNNAWERSQKKAQGSAVIFEGALERSELQWSISIAKDQELIPVEDFENAASLPRRRLTFRV